MITMFASLDIQFHFFNAIDKTVALDICNQAGLAFKEGSLTLGELGCFMSHFSLWQKMIDDNLPYMVIFEDDVIVSPNILRFIDNIEIIMSQCQAVHLETMLVPTVYDENVHTVAGLEFLKMKTEHMGLAGYVLTQDIAKLLVTIIQNEGITKPVDHYLCLDFVENRKDVDFYQINPALVIQDDVLNKNKEDILNSALESERKVRMNQESGLYTNSNKLIRELKRIQKQLYPRYWRNKRRQKYIKNNGVIIPFDNLS